PVLKITVVPANAPKGISNQREKTISRRYIQSGTTWVNFRSEISRTARCKQQNKPRTSHLSGAVRKVGRGVPTAPSQRNQSRPRPPRDPPPPSERAGAVLYDRDDGTAAAGGGEYDRAGGAETAAGGE